jgi:uncharacterized protein with von Willebrand factor type A (vWA) domain
MRCSRTSPTDSRRRRAASQLEIDAALTWSDREQLRKADFDTMTRRRMARPRACCRSCAGLRADAHAPHRAAPHARPARLARHAARHGAPGRRAVGHLRWRAPRIRPAPLVVLADISGSMSRYSRMLLHFAHALGHADAQCRELRLRHPAVAHHAAC